MENGRKLWRNRKFLRLIQQERTPRDVDRNRELTKFPNPQRRVTFQEDPTEMAADQRMMLRRNRGINYRALAGMIWCEKKIDCHLIYGRGMCYMQY